MAMLSFSSLFCRVKGGLRAGRAYCRFYNPHSAIKRLSAWSWHC